MRFLLMAALLSLVAPQLVAQEADAKAPSEASTAAEKSEPEPRKLFDTVPVEGRLGEYGAWRLGGSFSVTSGTLTSRDKNRNALPEEGFIGEFALSAQVKVSEKLTGHARLCWGCHELELESAHVQWRPSDAWLFRAGRFALPIGGGNENHDQSVRQMVSKPMTRSMGNMVRQREFNLGVLPAPTADIGVSFGGTHELDGLGGKFEWDLFAVRGFQGNESGLFSVPVGPNFNTSRSISEDNNSEPSFGAHLRFTAANLSLGLAWTGGNYNADGNRRYDIAIADAQYQLGALRVNAEVAWANTEYSSGNGGKERFDKLAYWLQLAYPVMDGLEAVAAIDGMGVGGIRLGPSGPGEAQPIGQGTDESNQVTRFAIGGVYTTEDQLRFKANIEYWEFSDYPDTIVLQLGVTWSF